MIVPFLGILVGDQLAAQVVGNTSVQYMSSMVGTQ
ncbi:hypothetical protein JOD24_001425 [Kroppenstedtia sanguinis]